MPHGGILANEQAIPQTCPTEPLSGRKRWDRGTWHCDFHYWTFEEFSEFLSHKYPADQYYEKTLDVWQRCVSEESEAGFRTEHLKYLRSIVASGCPVSDWTVQAGFRNCILEIVSKDVSGAYAVGTSLRARPDGVAGGFGANGPRSVHTLEVVGGEPHRPQLKLWNATEGWLQASATGLKFWGTAETAAVFEVLGRASPEARPVTMLALVGGSSMGDFVIRHAPVNEAPGLPAEKLLQEASLDWEDVAQAARRAVDNESPLRGKKRHLQDSTSTFYTFQEMVHHFQRLLRLDPRAAVEYARVTWSHACESEEPCWEWQVIGLESDTSDKEDDVMLPKKARMMEEQ